MSSALSLVISLTSVLALLCVNGAPTTDCIIPNLSQKSRSYLAPSAGDNVTLKCLTDERNTTVINWLKDGIWFARRVNNATIVNEQNGYLVIPSVQPVHDNGNYTCIVRNHCGENRYTIVVKVGAPQWIEKEPPQSYFKKDAGENLILECGATAVQDPNITWLKDGVLFTRRWRNSQIIRNDDRYLLAIPDLIAGHDSGIYTCIVSNDYGELRQTIQVDVVGRIFGKPPKFTTELKNKTVNQGDVVIFQCVAYTATPSYTQWLRYTQINGLSADPETKELYFYILTRNATNIDFNNTHLIIANVTLNDAGHYGCIVINQYGDAAQDAWITVNVNHADSPMLHVMFIGITVAILIVTTAAITLGYRYCINHRTMLRAKFTVTQFTDECKSMSKIESFPYKMIDKRWQLHSDSVKLCEPVGEGAFGRVYRGILDGSATVAVKMLKESASYKELEDLMKEVSLMTSLKRHDNVIQLFGCTWTDNDSLQIVMEYAVHGNLRNFLRCNRSNPVDDTMTNVYCDMTRGNFKVDLGPGRLADFALQIAQGMEHLASLKIIHRDLAARNILVTENTTRYVLKIADFGLTREVVRNKDYYRHILPGRLPIKWMSPESITDNIYTTKSDVWSYGILMWEIYSQGDHPYPSVQAQDVYSLLKSGYRMSRPDFASDNIYDIMLKCWHFDACLRPDFKQLVANITAISKKEDEVIPKKTDFGVSVLPSWQWTQLMPDNNGNLSLYDAGVCMSSQSDTPLISRC